jgi:hypothetical protein
MDVCAKTRRSLSGKLLLLCLAALLALIAFRGIAAAAEAAAEYQIKAVFLFNFTHFVEWPAQAFVTPSEPFVIGILGDDPFGARLEDVIRNERIGDHPLIVRRFRKPEDLGTCQMLFIERSQAENMGQVIASLNHRAVLTVSDIDGAAERGVIIQLATENSHIRLRINAEAAHSAGLVVSSKLLHLADIVNTRPGD